MDWMSTHTGWYRWFRIIGTISMILLVAYYDIEVRKSEKYCEEHYGYLIKMSKSFNNSNHENVTDEVYTAFLNRSDD